MQDELQGAVCRRISYFAVRLDRPEGGEVPAAGSDDEFPNPARRVARTAGVLRRESLILVRVAGQHQVGVRIIEVCPPRREVGVMALVLIGGKPRVMPVGKRALRSVRGEVGLQPSLLR